MNTIKSIVSTLVTSYGAEAVAEAFNELTLERAQSALAQAMRPTPAPSSAEVIKNTVRKDGLVTAFRTLTSELEEFKADHKFRKNFVTLTQGVIEAIVNELEEFEEAYGYVAGKK